MAVRIQQIRNLVSAEGWWVHEKWRNGHESFEPLTCWLHLTVRKAKGGSTEGEDYDLVLPVTADDLRQINEDQQNGADIWVSDLLTRPLHHAADFELMGVQLKADASPRNGI